GYGRLATRAEHPTLTELLKRIMKQEGRHIDFYASQAKRRLEGHPAAQRVTRRALRRFWTPVGAGIMPKTEVRFLCHHLFGGPDGLAAAKRIDRQIDRLPGLSGLRLVEGVVSWPSAGSHRRQVEN
ncbi:MAG: ferritin-like domain-containing protein, partial [Acidimicrobiales bacterium]